ncbi:MAG: twin-arginine translocation signal domain-containing protein [Blastocatellia bacterium]
MKKKVSRRTFLQTSAGLTAATAFPASFTIVKAESVHGTAANSMVEVGWIGLGGRGTRDAYLLEKTGKTKIVAVADYFQYRIDNLFKPMEPGQSHTAGLSTGAFQGRRCREKACLYGKAAGGGCLRLSCGRGCGQTSDGKQTFGRCRPATPLQQSLSQVQRDD